MEVVAEEDRANHGMTTGMGMPIDVAIAAHRRRQKSKGSYHSGGICRNTPTTPGRQANYLAKLVI